MKRASTIQTLLSTLKPGDVFRRRKMLSFSASLNRDLKTLEEEGRLEKLSGGLYYFPKHSRWGILPPDEKEMLRVFLNSSRFLVVEPSSYNSLGLGLTQLPNFAWVYNRKRFLDMKLGGLEYRFRRPVDFPTRLSREFLLVDLLNNLNEVGEDVAELKTRVHKNLVTFDKEKVLENAELYGKVATKRFLENVYQEETF